MPLCYSHFAINQANNSSNKVLSSFWHYNESSLGECLVDFSKECWIVLADVGLWCGLWVEDNALTSVWRRVEVESSLKSSSSAWVSVNGVLESACSDSLDLLDRTEDVPAIASSAAVLELDNVVSFWVAQDFVWLTWRLHVKFCYFYYYICNPTVNFYLILKFKIPYLYLLVCLIFIQLNIKDLTNSNFVWIL